MNDTADALPPRQRPQAPGFAGLVSIYATVFIVTYQAAFDSGPGWLWFTAYSLDVVYLATRLHSFHKSGGWVPHSALAAEAISLLPTDLFCLLVPLGLQRWHVLALLRLNRLVRLQHLLRALDTWESALNSGLLHVHAVKIALYLPLSLHSMACVWRALVCPSHGLPGCQQTLGTWLESVDEAEATLLTVEGGALRMYVLSLYWGLATLTSTGYGDIHAVSIGEQWYSAACMLMGVALFGYLMGSLTSTLTNKEALRARFEQDFQALSGHMHRERLPSRLQARVRRYLQHLWSKKRGRVEEDLFGRLPLTMQSEVALSSASEMIVRVPSFATCEASFLRMAALALKPTLFQPQEEILSFGNVIPAMYFIVSGTVHITDREGLVRRKLHQGSLSPGGRQAGVHPP